MQLTRRDLASLGLLDQLDGIEVVEHHVSGPAAVGVVKAALDLGLEVTMEPSYAVWQSSADGEWSVRREFVVRVWRPVPREHLVDAAKAAAETPR